MSNEIQLRYVLSKRMTAIFQCSVSDCNATKHKAHGLCMKHYVRLRKYGNPSAMSKARHGYRAAGRRNSTYCSWQAMKQRCLNPKYNKFHLYGGRGIKVCDRWMSFQNFLADMGERPNGKTLDRFPDVNGNYELSNCRWADINEQHLNRRKY